ncbi:hypothetical protein JCM11641_003960 [Rhodosporidiobolus odoratus]
MPSVNPSTSTSSTPPSASASKPSTSSTPTPVTASDLKAQAPAQDSAAKSDTKGDKSDAEDGADKDVDVGPPSSESVVDMEVFGQLLEIDDDESHEFSKTLAFDYITQAEATFGEIEEALQQQDLDALSRKGHFLKGSSAALGLQRVQHSCEAMQHFGKRRDQHGEGPEVSEQTALSRCRVLLKRLRGEQEEAKEWIEAFYESKE